MRLWTIHPRYLDAKGLVALWREALLAQKVIQGKTRGYRNHPQLIRFKMQTSPGAAIAGYLDAILKEGNNRGYRFDGKKISGKRTRRKLNETRGQLMYEWRHLKRKLKKRDHKKYIEIRSVKFPHCHPIFRIVRGKVEDWERVK
jgi:hypothetical protein